MLKNLLKILGLGEEKFILRSYEVSKYGYIELIEDDQALYDLSRSYLLNYAQEWDADAQKQEELKHIMAYVQLPFKTPKRREFKLLKRDFKKELNSVDCTLTANDDGYKLAVVRIANILLEYKYRSKKLRQRLRS